MLGEAGSSFFTFRATARSDSMVCAGAATLVFWPVDWFFFVPARIVSGMHRGPFLAFPVAKLGTAGTKKGGQNGPPNGALQTENIMCESKTGVHFGLPILWVSDPSHTPSRGGRRQCILQECPAAGRNVGCEKWERLLFHWRACCAGWVYLVGSLSVVRSVGWHFPVGLMNTASLDAVGCCCHLGFLCNILHRVVLIARLSDRAHALKVSSPWPRSSCVYDDKGFSYVYHRIIRSQKAVLPLSL